MLLLPVILPVVPTSSLHAFNLDKLRQDFADTVGWPDLAAQVAAVYNALPAAQRATTSILTNNYGEAGAIDIYGGREHLPQAISAQLTFWYWKPANLDATTLVTVGFNPGDIAFFCGTVTRAGTVAHAGCSRQPGGRARRSSSARICGSPSMQPGRRFEASIDLLGGVPVARRRSQASRGQAGGLSGGRRMSIPSRG